MNHPFLRQLIHRAELPSTSDLARDLLAEADRELPLAIIADRQTRGRGRGRHCWWSDEGSLTFSLAIDPKPHGLGPSHEPRVALATAVAIIDAIRRGHPHADLGIRWPNDIESDGRKLGGILPERVDTDHGPRLVIGVGLNVLTRLDEAPPAVRTMATSLAELGAVAPGPEPLTSVFDQFVAVFAETLPRLAAGDPELAARWRALDTLRGHKIRVDLGPRVLSGTAAGIDEDGALLLKTEEPEPLRLFGGQVLRDR